MSPPETTSCRACGHRPWAADRFCSACGSSLDGRPARVGLDDPVGVPVDPAVDHVVELEAAGPRRAATAAPVAGGSWRRIGSVIVVLVVLVAGWRLVSGSTSNDDPGPASISETASETASEAAADADDATEQPIDPFDGKTGGTTAPAPATEFVVPPDGFWPEPSYSRDGLVPATSFDQDSLNQDSFDEDTPPERRAALEALYAPVPLTNLDVGAGSLAVDGVGGPVLVDLVTGDVSALAGRNQLLPVGALSVSPAGVVMRFADPIMFGGVNQAAGVVLPWDGGSPIELAAIGWQTADRAGNHVLSFSGSPSQARYLLTDLASGRTVSTTIAVADRTARVTRDGDVIFSAGADVIAAGFDLSAPDTEAAAVTYRPLTKGELIDTVGGFMVIDCDGYPTCDLQLFDDRFEPGARHSIDGTGLPLSSLGPVLVAPDGSGYARWVPSTAGSGSLDLVVSGGSDDRALPDLPVVFASLTSSLIPAAATDIAWAPNGSGLFLRDADDRTLHFLSLVSGRAIRLDLPVTSVFAVVTDETAPDEP